MTFGIYGIAYRTRPVNNWLESFDPEAHDGQGWAVFTADVAKAMRFETVKDAMTYTLTRSVTRPNRADGKPNRPLRGFTIEIRALEDQP